MAEQLGHRVRKAREAYGMSATLLAERAGITRQLLYMIESNRTLDPGVLKVKAIAEVLKVSVDYLLGRKDERTYGRARRAGTRVGHRPARQSAPWAYDVHGAREEVYITQGGFIYAREDVCQATPVGRLANWGVIRVLRLLLANVHEGLHPAPLVPLAEMVTISGPRKRPGARSRGEKQSGSLSPCPPGTRPPWASGSCGRSWAHPAAAPGCRTAHARAHVLCVCP